MSIYALEMPGRGRRFRDKLLDSLSSMVDEAVDGIIPYVNDKNLIFLGHSLGGLLAFETARELRRRGLALPECLFVSGVRAPHIPKRMERTAFDLPNDAFVKVLKRMNGTPPEVMENQEMLELMVPIIRKDFQMYETYQYYDEQPLECPITALGGTHDRYTKPEDIEAWSRHTKMLFSKHMLNGDHFFYNTNLKNIVEVIITTLSMQRLW